jgi:hypothetical protein
MHDVQGSGSKDRMKMSSARSEEILALGWLCLALVMIGCAHGGLSATAETEQFADPTEPVYPGEILKARAERLRDVQRWRTSLDALNQLIDLRRSARISRDRNGSVVSINDDSDLQHWRMEMETELLRAEGALSRLEQKVKADFHGEYPPGGPATRAEADGRRAIVRAFYGPDRRRQTAAEEIIAVYHSGNIARNQNGGRLLCMVGSLPLGSVPW